MYIYCNKNGHFSIFVSRKIPFYFYFWWWLEKSLTCNTKSVEVKRMNFLPLSVTLYYHPFWLASPPLPYSSTKMRRFNKCVTLCIMTIKKKERKCVGSPDENLILVKFIPIFLLYINYIFVFTFSLFIGEVFLVQKSIWPMNLLTLQVGKYFFYWKRKRETLVFEKLFYKIINL